jgi:hypothetical protein
MYGMRDAGDNKRDTGGYGPEDHNLNSNYCHRSFNAILSLSIANNHIDLIS